ncbi:MAG: hydroxymethylglutaryl-CoA synthase family protein [Chloroflexi bacterium]|nr:hydroxymethylglutaryl-CoA synthase family protein [Chloroflexota bacterium]
MIGIIATGAYIPVYRLSRDAIGQAWGRNSQGGERAVAGGDEDSLTMAVEAGLDCLAGVDRGKIDALYFASTTSPYVEKQGAALLAAALDLPQDIVTMDFANSLRCGSNALLAAFNTVRAGAARSVLVLAADSRQGYPRSEQEQSFGDGAAAVVVGGEGPVATLEAAFSCNNAIMDVWRKPNDTFVRTWEERWVSGEGWTASVSRALAGVCERAGIAVGGIDRLVLAGGSAAAQSRLVKSLGIEPEKVQDNFARSVGDAGAAQALLAFASTLRVTPAEGRVAVVAYGDGADALLFKVGEQPVFTGRRGVEGHIESKMQFPSYQRFLASRNLVEIVPGEPFRLLPSATATWREEATIIRCHASRCRRCGTVAFPIQRVCYTCRSKDDFEEVRLSEEKGTVFTYSIDNLAGRGDDPVVVQTVMEMDQTRARFYGLMTDCDPKQVYVGMPVELTFRRLYEGAGFYNYFWKIRPVRRGGC